MTDDIQEDQLIHETPGATPNFRTELAAQLAELVPEAIADGKVDVAKLKELLDGDVGDESERFGLFWPGKRKAMRAAQEPTTATLRPDKENSKDWDTTQNVFIEGDNLEVLKILQKHYHNKIKMIYIDPPYNTGKDFVYPDNYKEGLESYLEWTRQVNEEGKVVSTNKESEGRYHSNWLNMMYPRLKLARNLLADDGVIFISIDDNEFPHLVKLCDEIFGEINRIGPIIHNKLNSKNDSLNVQKNHEYILLYRRTSLKGTSSDVLPTVLKNIERIREVYEDGNRFYYLNDPITTRGEGGTLAARPNLGYTIYFEPSSRDIVARSDYNPDLANTARKISDIYVDDQDLTSRGYIPIRPPKVRGKLGCWTWGLDKFEREKDDLVVVETATGYVVRKRTFVSKSDIQIVDEKPVVRLAGQSNVRSVWEFSTSEGTNAMNAVMDVKNAFNNPKNLEMLKELLRIVPDNDAIVLDFFAGSGTSAHAVLELNLEDGGRRKFIQVQLPEPTSLDDHSIDLNLDKITDIARARIFGAAKTLQKSDFKDSEVDLGFRTFVLAESNFAKWRVSSDVDSDTLERQLFSLRDSSNDNATPDDLLIEILLKQGYSLTERLSNRDISGLSCRVVGENLVIAYLDEKVKPTLDQLRAIVDQDPQRIIILEDAFQGDDELKTNLAQLCKSKGIELWTA